MTKQRKYQLIHHSSILTIILTIVAVLLFTDFPSFSDHLKALDYKPSQEITNLTQDLHLTNRGKTILAATHPDVYKQDIFNKYCQPKTLELAVLGCYTDDAIYLYDIENIELTGVKQATLAHELLHAVWARTPKSTQEKLNLALKEVYTANTELLEERINNYPKEEQNNELHSIIGTEIALHSQIACPDSNCDTSLNILREHYAKYFIDQSTVVTFYNQYYSKFSNLKTEAEQIYAEIETNKKLISIKTKNCENTVTEINSAITEFNRRNENGYFTSSAAFDTARAKLITEQQAIEVLYKELENLVAATNQLIAKYNNNIAHTKGLIDSVNSNSSADKIINKIED